MPFPGRYNEQIAARRRALGGRRLGHAPHNDLHAHEDGSLSAFQQSYDKARLQLLLAWGVCVMLATLRSKFQPRSVGVCKHW